MEDIKLIRKKAGNRTLFEDAPVLHDGEFPYLSFSLLERSGIVEHLFTTRFGGVSKGIYATTNLSFYRGDEEEAVRENYRRIARTLHTDMSRMVCSYQTHTTNVRRVTGEDAGKGITRPRDYGDVDGLITDEPGLCLVTYYADCVPLFLVDPVHRAIGLAHSGWRGTVARMGQAALYAMREAFGTRPEDVLAAIGPSICQDCYEVSEDVAEQFRAAFPKQEERLLARGRKVGAEQKWQLDLWEANRLVFIETGVMEEKIQVTDLCTCCNPEALFSHRASAGQRGNLGAFLMLREV